MDKIVFAKVKDNAQIPARDSWNAGFDIYPCFEEESFIIEEDYEKLTEKLKASKSNNIYILATYTAMINYRKFLYSKGYIKKLW